MAGQIPSNVFSKGVLTQRIVLPWTLNSIDVIQTTINKILGSLELVQFVHYPGQWSWEVQYSVMSVWQSLDWYSRPIYTEKKWDLREICGTVRLTKYMGVPWNYFKKMGISNYALDTRKRMLSEIERRRDFVIDISTLSPVLPPLTWSKSVFELLMDSEENLCLDGTRISGDRTSYYFIFNQMKAALAEKNVRFESRRNYVSLLEGCSQGDTSHIERYLLNPYVCRDVCLHL